LGRETFRRWYRGAHCSLHQKTGCYVPIVALTCPGSCWSMPKVCSLKPRLLRPAQGSPRPVPFTRRSHALGVRLCGGPATGSACC
jgi:hypothetical protein